MSNPKLKRTKAVIGYTSSDGYGMDVGYSSHNNKHLPPHVPLLDAFEELSRILHLFGHGEEAMQRAKDAGARVDAFLATRAASQPPGAATPKGGEA